MKTLSEATKAKARKKGKLPKAPRKPKRSASAATLTRYIARYDAYVDKINRMASEVTQAENLRKKVFGA
jgi:hypothetical protein